MQNSSTAPSSGIPDSCTWMYCNRTPGYQVVKEIERFPDESTFRLFLKKLKWNHLIQLIAINKEVLHRKAKMEPKRLVWIDIDDTVITLFGEQEGAVNGYNPRYHGRPSFKVRVAFISGTGELLHLELNSGNAHGMKDFLSIIKEVEAMRLSILSKAFMRIVALQILTS